MHLKFQCLQGNPLCKNMELRNKNDYQVKLRPSQLWTQFLQLHKETWKIQDFNGFEPVTSRYRCDALTNWAIKPLTLGADHLWVPMFPWGMNHFIIKNDYALSGATYSVIIKFPNMSSACTMNNKFLLLYLFEKSVHKRTKQRVEF